jgi:hypothetical protein
MEHTTLRELAAGAALDDLDGGERREFERHLATCAPCRQLSTELDDVVGELALAAPMLYPPADLRGNVLAALREPVGARLALVPEAPRAARGPTMGRIARWGSLAAAAVFAIVAVGLAAQNQRLDQQVAAANAALADAQVQLLARQAAVAVAADPGTVTVALHSEPVAPAADAVVMFRPGTTEAYLLANDLPATPAGQVYQLWFADAAGVHALGTFHHDGQGPFVAPFGVDLASSAAAMVTLEPEGGAVGEPGPQVVFGEF